MFNLNRKSLLKLTFPLLALFVSSVGCSPRGETKSSSEILKAAQTRFMTALNSNSAIIGTDQPLQSALKKIGKDLDVFVVTASGVEVTSLSRNPEIPANTLAQISGTSRSLSAALQAVAGRSSFTSRPAMDQITRQLSSLADTYDPLLSKEIRTLERGQVQLMASRVYSILSAELESHKFMNFM